MSGLLVEHEGAWSYVRNLSPLGPLPIPAARFGPAASVAAMPNEAGGQFMDLAGDCQPNLVVLDGPTLLAGAATATSEDCDALVISPSNNQIQKTGAGVVR